MIARFLTVCKYMGTLTIAGKWGISSQQHNLFTIPEKDEKGLTFRRLDSILFTSNVVSFSNESRKEMGIKERREREKQVTRENILLAARRIARQEGWPALTIRKVAESIEYSPPMVYEYFASKDEILLELMREGFRQLVAAMQYAAATTQESEARIFAMVDAYWSFAMSNPELYQVMNGLGGVALDKQATIQAGRESSQFPVQVLEEWARDHGVVLEDPFGSIEMVWSLIHGVISLTMVERIEGGEARAKRLLLQTLHDLLAAWSAKKSG